ncbi:MAG TPA: hypothetical protein VFM18_15840, partial [Methanosarcina sp.]|nr:hypothetical protein [Methanosarcina sp.]
MITHEIQVVKETNNNHLWPYSASSPKTMSKIEYATYIEDIKSKFKVGDVLIGNFDADSPVRDMNNFNLFRFNILKDIQELHQHVKYINGKPECLYVQNLGSYH